jgi:hypothetical protein
MQQRSQEKYSELEKQAVLNKAIVSAGWDDAPHLDDQEKLELLASCEPHLRESRSQGIPHLGSGAIYPVSVDDIVVDPFQVPAWYYRGYGMDVGWNYTAVVWFAWDKDTDVIYLYDCYKREKSEPEVHAAAVNRRNLKNTVWVGAIDPAARSRSQIDGAQLIRLYRSLGLKLVPADNVVEAGIYNVYSRLSTGRLKVFKGVMTPWIEEYRMYRRDQQGKIVKTKDHLMDATRYGLQTGINYARQVNRESDLGTSSRNYGV